MQSPEYVAPMAAWFALERVAWSNKREPPKVDTYFGTSRQNLQDCTERRRPRFVRYRCTYSRHRFQS
jgi:hypothetical protein